MSEAIDFIEQLWQQGLEFWLKGEQLNFKGNKLLLTTETIALLKRYKPEIIAFIQQEPLAFQGFPLSQGQRGIFLSQQIALNSPLYNLCCCLELNNPVDKETLQSALNQMSKRHLMLSASFHQTRTHISQIYHPERAIALQQKKLTSTQDLEQWLDKKSDNAFSLNSDTLFKAYLIEDLATDSQSSRSILVVITHHIIADFWGLKWVLNDLQHCYKALLTDDNPTPLNSNKSYKDFVLQEQRYLQSDDALHAKHYWQKQLGSATESLNLPQSIKRPHQPSYRGKEYRFELNTELSQKLRSITKQHKISCFAWLLACYQSLLFKLNQAKRISIGIPIANRRELASQQMAGHFSNPLALFCTRSDAKNFLNLCNNNKQQLQQLLKFQAFPNECTKKFFDDKQLFETAFSWNQLDQQQASSDILYHKNLYTLQRGALLDLVLTGVDTGSNIELSLRFSHDIFTLEHIQRIAEQFMHLITQSIQAAENDQLQKFTLFSVDARTEHEKILINSVNPKPEMLAAHDISDLFDRSCERYSRHIALDDGQSYRYQQLQARAHCYAKRLQQHGIQANNNIGLLLPRGFELLAASLGALYCGASYTPIDASYPSERIHDMLNSSDAKLLISDNDLLLETQQALNDTLMLVDSGTLSESKSSLILHINQPTDIACVLFTSGSTGRPKAVPITHQAIIRLAMNNGFLQLQAGQRMCYLSNVSFDAANIEIWNTLFHGACLLTVNQQTLLTPKRFADFIEHKKPDAAMITTALFNVLVDYQADLFKSFTFVTIGGESASKKHLLQCLKAGKPTYLYNLYGPTENGTVSTAYLIEDIDSELPIPIGRSISNSETYILDPHDQQCALSVKGEIVVGGLGVSPQYLKQPELSCEKFMTNVINGHGLLYRTGDMGYINEQGLICYAGREDNQLNIRGFRVELGEVEQALSGFKAIKQSCLDVRYDNNGHAFLAAFYTADQNIDIREIQQFLKKDLPDFMMPQAYKQLENFQITQNGKLDKRQLPDINIAHKTFVATKTNTEKAVLLIWQETFKLEKISINDNFFDLGGHSLLAVTMAGKLQQHFNIDLHMRLIFEHPDIETLSQAINHYSKNTTEIKHQDFNMPIPASLSQQRLWFLQQLNSQSNAYNMPVSLQFSEEIKQHNIEQALTTLIQRHDALRYRFIDQHGRAMVNTESINIKQVLHTIDLRQLSSDNAEKETQRVITQLALAPFDLQQGPLLRALLIRIDPQQSVLTFCLHHIIADGWSVNILLQELGVLLHAPNAILPELPITYQDYSVWQHEKLQGNFLKQQLSYWQQQLDGANSTLNLPLDKLRPAVMTNAGAEFLFGFNETQSEAIRALAHRNNATVFMVLISAYSLLLARYCGEDDICIGFPISGREQTSVVSLVGLLVNNLILRQQFDFTNTVSELIQQVKKNTLAAYSHQAVPFDQIIDSLAIERSLSYTPFLQASFSLEKATLQQSITHALGKHVRLREMNWHVAKYDIHLSCFDDGHSPINAQIEYNRDLFNEQTITQMAQHFTVLVNALCRHSHKALSDIHFLSDDEIAEQLNPSKGLNATQHSYPHYASISNIIDQQSLKTPHDIAVSDARQQLSYQQLNRQANQLAHYLQAHGIANSAVAVCLERSCDLSIVLLGILTSGNYYVPMLSDAPTERLSYMLKDTQAKLIISQRSIHINKAELFAHADRLNISTLIIDDNDHRQLLASGNDRTPIISIDEKSLFAIIYTSGSSGKPKGVMVSQQGIINRLQWMQKNHSLNRNDKVLQKTPFNFDVSIWELFWPLMVGAQLHHAKPEGHKDPDYLRDVIIKEGISTLHFVPSMLGVFLHSEGVKNCRSIQRVFTSGETLQQQHNNDFHQQLGFAELHNLYGPTEASIDVSHFTCQPNLKYRSIPIGKPIDNIQLLILGNDGNLLPKGAAGELHIGGIGLAQGYWNKRELSQQKFIRNPFKGQGIAGDKLYKTGDIARYLNDGNIEYLGRNDQQVKIRGLRIELSEIEQQLQRINGVEQALVATHKLNGQTQLIAFIVGPERIDKQAYRHLLQQQLPEYMLPFAYISIDAIPLSVNGKIDRKRLPFEQLTDTSLTHKQFVAPRNDTETSLQGIWQKILQIDNIGIHDNFFELGGHSLLATRLAAKIRQQFSCALELKAIFDHPSIADLSVLILEQTIKNLNIDDDELLALLNDLEDE